ncbi:MAG TPA: selenium metabolism-associated LysR family transcriptional regulator [Syntrophomonadaceae bacterium]|nr:selenium metabolism-associated LysR family transcriptional regulator [Syntrophomonadaceae bacterium]HNX27838.1 selenium metabolism-associated LysR family transcriptional regulator [Syntrophomonadaceae bacterium]HPR93630.1 selenium metabolism-associated LysR family transcriptional regulator [Syntrophomonadaceae bacterium]
MNLNLFKTYVRVVETQNLSRTAEEFDLSQPAVTKQIQALEDMYGVLLLERSGRKLKTTEAGETLYECAREILKVMERTEKAMEEISDSRKGSLYLGASTIPGQYILPYIIKMFKDKMPSISISMDIADTEKIVNLVADREIDVGIVGGWISNRKIEGYNWLEDDLVLIVPENNRLAQPESGDGKVKVSELLRERWIFREKGSGTRKAAEELLLSNGIRNDALNIYLEAGSTEAVLAAVEAGMGIAIVSSWAIKRLDAHRRIRSLIIDDANAKRSFYVIYPKQKTRRKSVEAFLSYIKQLDEVPGK